MINIFEVFLPQLLRYPNPNDPLNGEAAALLMRHPKEYEAKVKGGCPWMSVLSWRQANVDFQNMYIVMRRRKRQMQQPVMAMKMTTKTRR